MKQDFFNGLFYIIILLILILAVYIGVQTVITNQQNTEYYQKYVINKGA